MATLDAHIDALAHAARPAPTQPLRVLLLHRDLAYDGGVPKCFLYFCQNNTSHRFDLSVASFEEPAVEMTSAFAQLDIRTHCIGDHGYFRPAMRLRRLVRSEGLDVVVASSFKAYIVAKMAVAGTPTRVIFWMHAAQNVLIQGWRRVLFRYVSRDDTLVCVSDAVRRSHAHYSHRGATEVVYNGVEDPQDNPLLQPYKRSMRAALGLPDDALVMCYVASFVPWKDHQTLLEAFGKLDHETLNAHLLLIGGGALEADLRRMAAELPFGNRVHFLGPRPDARRLLGVVDLYVHTCREEGFGLALVEAMLAEKPVIAPRQGAPPEYITHGREGLLFEPGDPDDLADKITAMVADPDTASAMAARARLVCLEKFAPRKFYEAMCEVIERAALEQRETLHDLDAELVRHA